MGCEKRNSQLVSAGAGFLLGSVLLIIFSIFQKIIVGSNLFVLKGYIVPFWYGGIAGALLACKCAKVKELNKSLQARLNVLEEYLPICSHCKKIRETEKDPTDSNSWISIEDYISERTSSRFSHSLCPDCIKEWYPDFSSEEA